MGTAVHHLEDCVYLPETCPLGCVSLEGEVVKMERRHIAGHIRDSCALRKVECEFCEGEVTATEMNLHLEACDEFPLPCPNRCGREGDEGLREVKRKDIPVHLDEHCPLQKVQCAYWEHGCREEMERRHTDTHEREFLHVHFKLSMTRMEQKQNESTQLLRQELDIANEKIAVASKELAVQDLRFTELQKELKATTVKSKMLSQDLTAAANQIRNLEKQNSDKDDRIITLSEVLFSYLQSQLPTGRLEWNVKEVKQNIQDKKKTYGVPFYVGLYKCQSKIVWDYKNTGNVGVFIHILRGDFDAKLHWPIRYRRTFILTNQIDSKDNLVKSGEITKETLEKFPESLNRPTEYSNEGLGSISFISNTDILGRKYCKQDSITLHTSVELLPPL